MKTVQIAIDGPAGAGKSTIAKRVAKSLGYIHIDTGAMYRAITLKAIRCHLDLSDQNAFDFIDQTRFDYVDGAIIMDGEDVSRRIRERDISNSVSLVSSHYIVREKIVARQQRLSKDLDIVMDGRDIGYNVLPRANYKFYLTADVKTRALRRYKENLDRGIENTIAELEEEINARDAFDTRREHSPLKPASDAIVIDTSNMSIEAVVDTIIAKIREDEA